MRPRTALVSILTVVPQVLAAWPSYYTELAELESPYRNEQPNVKVETVFQFPNNGSWVDNIVLRRDGSILLTRLDVPEVWSVDAETGDGTMVYSFPNATSCFGISEIDDDVFAVVVGNFSTTTYQPTAGSFSVQKLEFLADENANDDANDDADDDDNDDADDDDNEETRVSDSVVATPIVSLPEAQALNGMTAFTKESRLVLIADSPKGVVWKVNTETGDHSIALNDTTMMPAEGVALPLGINGLKVVDEYVYYSSTTRMQFCRVKVNKDAEAVGDYQVIASGFLPDNMDVAEDGTAYIATDPQNSVVRVTPYGQISLVAGGQLSTQLPGATSTRLAPDGKTLYVGTSGGQVAPVLGTFKEPAKVVKISFL